MSVGAIPVSFKKKLTETNKAQVITTESRALSGTVITAKSTNAEPVHIGSSTVAATSYELVAGQSLSIDIVDLSRVYVYGKENDEVNVFGLAVV